MDEVTRPKRAAQRRSTSVVQIDDNSETEEESLPSSAADSDANTDIAENDSVLDDGKPELRVPDPKATRFSARTGTQKSVNYSTKHHPQNNSLPGYQHKARKLAKQLVRSVSTTPTPKLPRSKASSTKKRSAPITGNEDANNELEGDSPNEKAQKSVELRQKAKPRKALRTLNNGRQQSSPDPESKSTEPSSESNSGQMTLDDSMVQGIDILVEIAKEPASTQPISSANIVRRQQSNIDNNLPAGKDSFLTEFPSFSDKTEEDPIGDLEKAQNVPSFDQANADIRGSDNDFMIANFSDPPQSNVPRISSRTLSRGSGQSTKLDRDAASTQHHQAAKPLVPYPSSELEDQIAITELRAHHAVDSSMTLPRPSVNLDDLPLPQCDGTPAGALRANQNALKDDINKLDNTPTDSSEYMLDGSHKAGGHMVSPESDHQVSTPITSHEASFHDSRSAKKPSHIEGIHQHAATDLESTNIAGATRHSFTEVAAETSFRNVNDDLLDALQSSQLQGVL